MIHPSVVMFGQENIEIGENVRIDAFCILSAGPKGLRIGDHVHIAAGVYIFGASGRVELQRFVGLSARTSLYTGTDDFMGGALSTAAVPEKFRNVTKGDIICEEHALVGVGSVILPGVTLGRGSSVGALSIVKRDVPAYHVVVGTDQRKIGERDAELLAKMERDFLCASTFTRSVGTTRL